MGLWGFFLFVFNFRSTKQCVFRLGYFMKLRQKKFGNMTKPNLKIYL